MVTSYRALGLEGGKSHVVVAGCGRGLLWAVPDCPHRLDAWTLLEPHTHCPSHSLVGNFSRFPGGSMEWALRCAIS